MTHDKFLKLYKYLCVAIFFLIALGGSVRAMNAGLACPDWPLCFGEIIPDYHPQVYFEFVHRVLAGTIGLVSIFLNIKIFIDKSQKSTTRWISIFAILLLFVQIVMGGLTVLLKLHDKVVALHLALGTGFFLTSYWIYLTLKFQKMEIIKFSSGEKKKLLVASIILFVSVYTQLLLGGLVASNYAANVCPDFPLCHGEWIPTVTGTIGLHVIHRLGAYTLCAIIIAFYIYVQKNITHSAVRKWSRQVLVVLAIQVTIGISNVLLTTPPLITVLHLATGTYLLSLALRLVRYSSAA